MRIPVTQPGWRKHFDCVSALFERVPGGDRVRVGGICQQQYAARMPDRYARALLQCTPLLHRSTRKRGIDLVRSVATAQDARLVARAGAWVSGTVGINERDAAIR